MKRFILAILVFTLSGGVNADEGMWTFDNLPKADIAKRPARTPEWETRLLKNSAEVRQFGEEVKRRLDKWSDE